MQEIWLPINGFDGFYEVSSFGVVRSVGRFVKQSNGRSLRTVLGCVKTPNIDKSGYHSVHLYKEGKLKKFYIHRLVASAFLKNLMNLPQVNHKNGIKSENCVSNLEWCTPSENCSHAIANKLYERARGEAAGNSKITESDVREIRRAASSGITHKSLSSQYGIGREAIRRIVNLQRWKHVT